jgi:hypothetical protein
MKMMMDEDREVWDGLEGFDGYDMSSKGRVRSYWKFYSLGHMKPDWRICSTPQRILKPSINGSGYLSCVLRYGDVKKTRTIHKLLARSFIPNLYNLDCVDHIDRVRTNNNLTNLRWVSKLQNAHNRSRNANNTSGVSGVGRDRSSWYSSWSENGVRRQKKFKTKEEAIEHRQLMEELHYKI